jgi:O-antigen ligase
LFQSSTVLKPTMPHYFIAILLSAGVLDAAFFPLAADGGIRIGSLRVIDLLGITALVMALLSGSWRQLTRSSFCLLAVLTAIWTIGTVVALIPQSASGLVVANLRIWNGWRFIVFLTVFLLFLSRTRSQQVAIHGLLSKVLIWATIVGAVSAFTVVGDMGPDLVVFLGLAFSLSRLVGNSNVFNLVLFIGLIAGIMMSAQRANILFVLPAVVLSWLLTRRKNPRTGAAKLALGLIFCAVCGLALVITGLGRRAAEFADWFWARAFTGVGNHQAAQSRIFQWSRAIAIIEQAPWIGHGLGAQYVTYEYGGAGYMMTGITHNIVLDMSMAFGIPLGLGVVGFLLSGMLRGLGRDHDATVRVSAVLGLGLLAKGLVESILDKPRLELVLAFLIAVVLTANKGANGEVDSFVPINEDDRTARREEGILTRPTALQAGQRPGGNRSAATVRVAVLE